MSKYEELSKLKELLDAGVLNKEEFEAEKKKILDASEEVKPSRQVIESKEGKPTGGIAQDAKPLATDSFGHFIFDDLKESTSETECNSEKESSSPQEIKRNKGLGYIAIIVLVVFFLGFILVTIAMCGGNRTPPVDDSYNVAVDSAITDTAEVDESSYDNDDEGINYDNFVQEGSDEDFEINCPWKKEYFHNEFGEDMPEHPYIATSFGGSWNLEIAYSHEMGFRFALRDNDGEYKHMYSPVSIVFRTKDGKMYNIAPNNVENYCAFVQNQDDVKGIARLLDTQSKFDILMSYKMYNEPHKMTWNVDFFGGTSMFNKAVEKLLNQ